MVPDAAAALLLLCAVSAGAVPPPTNVTVSCHNLKTSVSWNHSERSQTRFLVSLLGSHGSTPRKNETSACDMDLTDFLWDSEESAMDYHYVTVTAVRDGNQSATAKSESFSFNRLKTSHKPCLLDFPPVDLTVRESVATVAFQNPLSFYRKLDRVTRPDFYFEYIISTFPTPSELIESCPKEVDTCKRDFPLPDGATCVTLEGRMCNRDCLGEVAFRKTDICQNQWAKVLTVTLALLLGVLVFVVVVVTVSICRVRGWTMEKKDPQMPTVLIFQDEEKRAIVPRSPRPDTVERALPLTTLVSDCPTTRTDGSEEDDDDDDDSSLHHCRNAYLSSEEGYLAGGLSEDSNQAGSDQTECVSLLSEDECATGYDRPQRLVDMGDGDMVTSYGNR